MPELSAEPLSWQMQTALFGMLAPVLAPVPLFDRVPDRPDYPFVVLGEDVATDWPVAVDIDGTEVELTFHVWSRYAGMAEAKRLMATVHAALQDRPPPLDGYHVVSLRFLSERCFLEPDAATRHGVIRFRARVVAG